MAFFYLFIPAIGLALFLLWRYSRLSNIPGPFLASLTDLWQFYHQSTYYFTDVLLDLHAQYGPLVRIGPNRVSISKAWFVELIYTGHGKFRKADSYHNLRVAVGADIRGSMMDMIDEKKVKDLKKATSSIFMMNNLTMYEPEVEEIALNLIERISQKQTVDLFETLMQFQIDFLMNVAFSEHQNYLSGKDPMPISGHTRITHFVRWQSMPNLEHLLYKTPFLNKNFRKSAVAPWMTLAMDSFEQRITGKHSSLSKKPDLLDKYIHAQEKYDQPDLVRTLVSLTIGAGFDTTAFTSTAILYLLLKNPRVLVKLRHELENGGLSDPPAFRETDKLEYWGAVIKEALRMYPILNLVLERVVPDGGMEIGGIWLPGGTIVGCHPEIVGRDPECYGEDVDVFRPERWLTQNVSQRQAMDRGFLGFRAGNRMCLGKSLAWLVMRKLIPLIVTKFEMVLVDPEVMLESVDGLSMFPKPVMVRFTERVPRDI
ncbi:cytochrome P450 [Tothia fuscella]|uniref:Cytochrome P450 n=1 Tax=Tothia fuscella TaxID=1048955 RepID=A0A9P4NHX9_9PEZI|nr:cytochrome P450 [Tothia fuscella]